MGYMCWKSTWDTYPVGYIAKYIIWIREGYTKGGKGTSSSSSGVLPGSDTDAGISCDEKRAMNAANRRRVQLVSKAMNEARTPDDDG